MLDPPLASLAQTATISASAISAFQGNLSLPASNPTVDVPAAKGWLLAVHGPSLL